ncbi:ABC transporter substrate-binding protein [bacterium]|nr:MAG: ABC transporter substrate-binding protein [bacterium]
MNWWSLGVAALVLAGCGSSGESGTTAAGGAGGSGGDKKIVMGFCQIGGANEWRVANTKSAQDAAKEAGIELKLSDGQDKQENQIKAMRAFIAQGVDVIVLSPVVETGWEPVLQEAKKAQIPVIIADRKPDASEDLYVTVISSDYVKEGEMAAEWLAKKTDDKATIAEIAGTPGSAPANDRHKGFETILAKHPGMKVVFSQSGEWNVAKGKETTEAMLKSAVGKTVNTVFAHNDDMALGAIQAIQEAGRKPGTEVIVISIDGTKKAFEAMKDGTLNCTVECNPLTGPQLMSTAKEILAGKTVEKRITYKDAVWEMEQAAAELPNRKY